MHIDGICIKNPVVNTEEIKKEEICEEVSDEKTNEIKLDICTGLCPALKPNGTICNKKIKGKMYCGYHKSLEKK